MRQTAKIRFQFAGIFLLALFSGLLAYPKILSFAPPVQSFFESKFVVNRGLDLQGGIHLEYIADTSEIPDDKKEEALEAAHSVIERRVNAFGVAEPLVQRSHSGGEDRIIVELPGIKNIEEAKAMIKETPFLEFREPAGEEILKQFEPVNAEKKKLAETTLAELKKRPENFETIAREKSEDPGSKDKGGDLDFVSQGAFVPEFNAVIFDEKFSPGTIFPELVESQFGWHIIKKIEERGEGDTREVRAAHILFGKLSPEMFPELQYQATGLSGKNLKNAFVDYQSQGLGTPQVMLEFDDEGAKLFAEITKRNINKPVAIVLDGEIVSQPTVQSEILGGTAVITGSYSLEEANDLVRRLNEGALPVPITLDRQLSVDASLGAEALEMSITAGLIGLAVVAVFMFAYYRFFGLVAVVALLLYSAMLLSIFKLSTFTPFAITVTLSGIAGFILSIGMAVDANVLIFERIREELGYGKNIHKAIEQGFKRAWPSIRDGNYSTLITTFILMGVGTGFVQGFAVILTIGILLSMFTAVVLVRISLKYLIGEWAEKHPRLLVPAKKIYETKE